jgi:hypothetical protein
MPRIDRNQRPFRKRKIVMRRFIGLALGVAALAPPAADASAQLMEKKVLTFAAAQKMVAAAQAEAKRLEMQGGLPIVVYGRVIGGIGASVHTSEHDVEIAQTGLAALTNQVTQ